MAIINLNIYLGQSQIAGRGLSTRTPNTSYFFKGMASVYPATRTTQQLYSLTPANVFIWYKGQNVTTTDLFTIQGQWQAYSGGVNSCPDRATASYKFFGPELTHSVQIQEATGNDTYIIKLGYGGTSLITDEAEPGAWNNKINTLVSYELRVAIKNLRAMRPNDTILLQCVDWGQGETDGARGVSKEAYKSAFRKTYKVICDAIMESMVLFYPIPLKIQELNFNRDAGEDLINSALQELAIEFGAQWIQTRDLPRKIDETAEQKSPVATDPEDDNHFDYLAQGVIGERLKLPIKTVVT